MDRSIIKCEKDDDIRPNFTIRFDRPPRTSRADRKFPLSRAGQKSDPT